MQRLARNHTVTAQMWRKLKAVVADSSAGGTPASIVKSRPDACATWRGPTSAPLNALPSPAPAPHVVQPPVHDGSVEHQPPPLQFFSCLFRSGHVTSRLLYACRIHPVALAPAAPLPTG